MAIKHRIFFSVAYVGIFLTAGSAHAVDGQFDSTFANGGRELLAFSTEGDFGRVVRETADGKLIAAGGCDGGGVSCVARLLKNGNLDPNFGVLGLGYSRFDQFTGVPTSSQFLDMTLLPDGRMAFATLSSDFSNINVHMVLADGTGLDHSVGNGTGFIAKIFPSGSLASTRGLIRRQSDGNFLVASTIQQTGVGSVWAVARVKADLSALDATFGAQGIAEIAFGLPHPEATPISSRAWRFKPTEKSYWAAFWTKR